MKITLYLIELKPGGCWPSINHLVSRMYQWLGKLEYTHCALMMVPVSGDGGHEVEVDGDGLPCGWLIENSWYGTSFTPYSCLMDVEFARYHKLMRVTQIQRFNPELVSHLAQVLYRSDIFDLLETRGGDNLVAAMLGLPPNMRGSLGASLRYWRGKTKRTGDYICTDAIARLVWSEQPTSFSPQMLKLTLCAGETSILFPLAGTYREVTEEDTGETVVSITKY